MTRRRLAPSLRLLASPLTVAIVIAILGVTSAALALAVRGHFSASAPRAPLAVVTPAAASGAPSASSATAGAPAALSGRLASTVVFPLSSDQLDSLTIDAGTQVSATTTQVGSQLSALTLDAGLPPSGGQSNGDKGVSGSTATATTFVVATASGPVSLTLPQDSVVTGSLGHAFSVQFTAPRP